MKVGPSSSRTMRTRTGRGRFSRRTLPEGVEFFLDGAEQAVQTGVVNQLAKPEFGQDLDNLGQSLGVSDGTFD